VSTSTSFQDRPDGVAVDGTVLTAPYTVLAIGDPATLDTALNIPGGVAAVVRAGGGQAGVQQTQTVRITATRQVATPSYATPTPK
jgi:uncharacterized protein YlxW (UPF0749 family)